MKKLITVLLLVSGVGTTLAQADTTSPTARKYEFGVRSGFYGTAYFPSLNYFTYLTIGSGIHELSLGPSLGKPGGITEPFYVYNPGDPYKLNGIDLTYRIFPNGKHKVFDFYFELNYFQKWQSPIADELIEGIPANSYDKVKVRSTASQLILDYGFDIKFLKYIYIGGAIGIGGHVDFRNYQYETYVQYNYKETLLNLDVITRVNIGVRF
jgi:hypothetical protein